MAVDLLIAAEAERTLQQRTSGMRAADPDLGEEFLTAVDACLEGVRRGPEINPVVHESYRRSLIRRFPYAVFYGESGTTVTIYAVFHTSRNPDKWRQRLS
jgi:plasmid stabilization system protein ParE